MNRETLDIIVRDGLFAYATSLLAEIGRECAYQDFHLGDGPKWAAGRIEERERALKLLSDDAARLKIVDEILKEMK